MTTESPAPYPVVLRAPDVDWIKFDAELARDGSVEPVVKALYAALASFADQTSRDTDETVDEDEIPTRKRLAACIGKSVDTVDRSIKKLEEIHLLEVERRKDPNNPRSNIPSIYRLLDRERWDERAGERAAKRRAERERERQEAERAKREKAEREQAEKDRAEAAKKQEEAPEDSENRPCSEDCEGWPHGCGQGGRMGAARVAAWVRPGWPHGCGGTSFSQEKSSSSSGGTETSPVSGAKEEEEEDAPSVRTTPPVAQVVMTRTGATADEADAVIESIEDHAERNTIEIGSIGRYVAGFDDADLRRHLRKIRAQRAPDARAGASEGRRITSQGSCVWHSAPAPCQACRVDLNAGGPDAEEIVDLYTALGSDAAQQRPDLAAHPAIAALSGAH